MKKQKSTLYSSVPQAMDSMIQVNKALLSQLESYNNIDTKKDPEKVYCEATDSLIKLLEARCKNAESPDYLALNNNFTSLSVHLDFYEDRIDMEQSKERFSPQKDDSFLIRFLKIPKRIKLHVTWAGTRLGNVFRKKKRELVYPKHNIREINLAKYIYLYKFHLEFFPLFRQFLQTRYQVLRAQNHCDNQYESFILDNADTKGNFTEEVSSCKATLDALLNDLIKEITLLEEKLNTDFLVYRQKAGTIEFPTYRYRARRVKKKTNSLFKQYQKLLVKYHVADQAVTEYWLFESGIRAAVLDINQLVLNGAKELKKRGNESFLPDIDKIISTLKQARNSLEDFQTSNQQIKQLSSLMDEGKSLAKVIIERAAAGELSQHYESIYPAMLESLAQVPERSLFSVKVFEATSINKKYALKKVHGMRILKDILDNTIQDRIVSEGKILGQQILNLNSDIEELLQLIEYSYEYYGPKEGNFPDEDKKELDAGLSRALKKAGDFKSELVELVDSTNTLFIDLNDKFRQEIRTSLEPAVLISTDRKNRVKGIWRQSRKNSTEGISIFNTGTSGSLHWLTENYKKVKNRYFNLRNLLGISESKEILSSEIADYLADTDKSISQLPLMYQRLFTNKPLEDERFFVKRDKAENQLEKAFLNWKEGKFAPTCIVAEKGGGATTFLNFFEKSIKEDFEIRHIDLTNRILTEDDFYTLLHKIFPELRFTGIEELLIQLKKRPEKIVVCLENIQSMFMKRTGGFSNLNRFFNLISQSNSTVFWLCSCLEYSWRYLVNTCEINEYFAYVINLHQLTKETLTEAIMKRHRPSGFEMVFRSDSESKKPIFFLRSKKLDTQAAIKDAFFDTIRSATHGNLSFAFLLWLRSVDHVEDNIIYFKYHKLNLGFLRSLSVQKLTSLYSILIHSGLTCNEHAEIFNLSENESFIQLMVMTDDGILIQKQDTYKINPLLYRQVVNHLESTNFIH